MTSTHPFQKVVVFGVGLIGGSFALALKQAGIVKHIVGVGRTQAALERALSLGIIDEASTSVADAVNDADLVLIAAPVAQTGAILERIAPHVQPGTIITDAGSTKGNVVAAARGALGHKIAQFVPGHPIAGSERNGPDAAMAGLYQGKKIVLTALPENAEADVERVAYAWEATGGVIHRLTVEDHDAIFASVSHLPHLLAFALVDDIAAKPHADVLFQYAASGFRDFTRIAGSSAEMWRDISFANRPALMHELDAYIAQLIRIRTVLVRGDSESLEEIYSHAQLARQRWLSEIESAEGIKK